MVCPRCDSNIHQREKLFKIIKRAYCRDCGSIWHPAYNEMGKAIGWEIIISDEEWKKFRELRLAEVIRANEEFTKRGIKNESASCGNNDE
jgi:hypothetical protein